MMRAGQEQGRCATLGLYEKLNEYMDEAERDREARLRLLAESKARVEEWRKNIGKQ